MSKDDCIEKELRELVARSKGCPHPPIGIVEAERVTDTDASGTSTTVVIICGFCGERWRQE
jgi:hypothetical protein